MDQPDLLDQPFDDPDLPHRYRGKRVIVTGAASGIGRSSAIRLAAEGAQVWCADINGDGAAATAAEITDKGGEARSSRVDVTSPAECAGAGRRRGRGLRWARRAVQHRRHRRHGPLRRRDARAVRPDLPGQRGRARSTSARPPSPTCSRPRATS